MSRKPHPGVLAALTAAVLFGASTPLSKLLLDHTSPLLLASLLYLGSGVGLFLLRLARRSAPVRLPPRGVTLADRCHLVGRRSRPSAAYDRAGFDAGFGRFFAFKCRGSFYRAAGMVCLQGELRSADRPGYGGHRGGCSRSELAAPGEGGIFHALALPRRFRRVPGMGSGQQFHSQSVTD